MSEGTGAFIGRNVGTTAAGKQRVKMGDVTVTTTDAAAARHVHKRLALAAFMITAALGLSGCGTSNLLGGGGGDSASAVLAEPAAASNQAAGQTRVTIAPVVGAPEAVGRQLSSQLASAAERQRVSIAKAAGDPSDYTLRGYMVAAKERSGVKLSYIWDLTDTQGKRVNRFQGEEIVAGGDNKDPWASISPAVIQTIADKTATGLSSAIAGLPRGGAGGGSAPGGSGAAEEASRVAGVPGTGATGSIGRPAGVTAVIPAVVGAPGDGKTALADALRSELSRNGVSVAENAAGAYRIEGRVAVGQATSGKQPIQIDWQVKDPAGKRLGTVSQKNEIPQGSLDGAWGQTADAAAAAAAQGIVKLLPGAKSTN